MEALTSSAVAPSVCVCVAQLEVQSLMEKERAKEEGGRERGGLMGLDMGEGSGGLSLERGVAALCQRLTRQHPSEFFQQLFLAMDTHSRLNLTLPHQHPPLPSLSRRCATLPSL